MRHPHFTENVLEELTANMKLHWEQYQILRELEHKNAKQ